MQIADNEKSTLFIGGIATDVTEHRLSEKTMQDIIAKNPLSIQIVDRNGFTLSFNPAHTKLFGAVPPSDYSVFDDFQLKQQGVGDLLERAKKGETVTFPDLYYNAHDLVAEFPDVPVWIRLTIFPLNDINGIPEKFVFTHENISARRQAEEVLKASVSLLDASLESTADGILIVNRNGNITKWNKKFAEMWQLSDQILSESNDSSVMYHILSKISDPVQFVRKISYLCDFPEVSSFDQIKFLDGRFFERYSQPQRIGNEIVGRVWSFRDVTERKKAEEALRESEERYRSFISQVSEGVYRFECDQPMDISLSLEEQVDFIFDHFFIAECNDSFVKMYGNGEQKDIIGKGHLDFYGDRYNKVNRDLLRKYILNGYKIENGITEELNLSGDLVYITNNSLGIIENNHLVRIWGTQFDITSRMLAENALKESEEKHRFLIENSHDIIYTLTADGILTFVSHAWTELLGHPIKQVVGESFQKFVHPDDLRNCLVWMQKVIKTGLRQEGIEYRVQHLNGLWLWHTSSAVPLRDEAGIVIGFEGTARDITERKLAEELFRQSEQKLSTLFASMTEMVVLYELVFNNLGEAVNYRITDCNVVFTEVTGIKKENAIQKLATEVYQTETPPFLDEYIKVATTGEPYKYYTYFAPTDKHFMISVVSPEINHFATISTDITAIRQIEEVITAKNKELENYLYVASHDLRSPLVNVQGFSQRLQKHADKIKAVLSECLIEPQTKESIDKIANEDIPKTLNFIFSNVSKMDTLINGLLQISRTGRIKMNIRKINMNKLFNNIIAAHNFQITELFVNMVVGNLDDCYGDENQLNQLFSNIIGNALKYSDKNRQSELKIASQTHYSKVIYSIKDSGIGIAPRHIEKIWDVFYRVDSSSPEAGEGLGLSIAKRIADKHKGKIWVESEEGKGSTFYVELQKNDFTE